MGSFVESRPDPDFSTHQHHCQRFPRPDLWGVETHMISGKFYWKPLQHLSDLFVQRMIELTIEFPNIVNNTNFTPFLRFFIFRGSKLKKCDCPQLKKPGKYT
jgi:hypothetical protein